MKKSLLILLCLSVGISIAMAQFTRPAKKKYRKRGYRNYAQVKKIQEDPNDSAVIYYNYGWDAYKNNDFGGARWFWERSANCETNTPSRYSSAFRLALLHQEGQGVGQNYEIAFYYLTLGWADGKSEGETEATKNIAAYFETGRLVQQDFYKALDWYEKAKKQGNKYCSADILRVKKLISQSKSVATK